MPLANRRATENLFKSLLFLAAALASAAVQAFTGSEACRDCHAAEYQNWRGSHHDLAMDVATEETVLGDFEETRYIDPHNQVSSRFFRENGKFMVATEGPDGRLEEFEVTHVFGVYPLQQYLVPFPGGRLQCLNIGWDARQNRWYRLPPYEVEDTNDWLHWTNGGQTWNGMCAECHSTRLQKNYDPATNTCHFNEYAKGNILEGRVTIKNCNPLLPQ